jgi:hypothetical protein
LHYNRFNIGSKKIIRRMAYSMNVIHVSWEELKLMCYAVMDKVIVSPVQAQSSGLSV